MDGPLAAGAGRVPLVLQVQVVAWIVVACSVLKRTTKGLKISGIVSVVACSVLKRTTTSLKISGIVSVANPNPNMFST